MGKFSKELIPKLRNAKFINTNILESSDAQTRNSHPEVFLGKGALKICSKFTGEHPCRSVISIKLLKPIFPIKITIHSFLMSYILKKYTPNVSKNHKTIYQRIFMSFTLIVNVSIHNT